MTLWEPSKGNDEGSCCFLIGSIRWWTYGSPPKVTMEAPTVLFLGASKHGLMGAF